MKVDLAGKVAIVTGGANGIGRAIVDALSGNGAHTVIVDIEEEAAQAAVREVTEGGGSCVSIPGDVADGAAMERMAQEVRARFGHTDILINNAGINTKTGRVPIHEFALEDWERILAVDLTGLYLTSKAVIPMMLASGGGRIVNITSIAGLVPLRLQSAFVAAKAGVANLTRSMALELGPQGILVNAVAPGSTLTRGTRQLFYGSDGLYTERAASLLAHIPLGRPGEPHEIAAMVLFLVAPEASYVNGAVIPVDGGWIAGYNRDW
ncbi:MAG: 3-oxoacyl-ACP reductase FabG [Chloroflexi bacterium]|nr:3-oxoacyl-ACP reductase FabG [Chloroflexota bacterium]